MKKLFALLLILSAGSCLSRAQTTPLNQTIPESTETKITCELTTPPRFRDVPVFTSDKEVKKPLGPIIIASGCRKIIWRNP